MPSFVTHRALPLALVLLLSLPTAMAQGLQPGTAEYEAWKASLVTSQDARVAPRVSSASANASFSSEIVPFSATDGTWTPLSRNDDGSTGTVPLGFDFEFYGDVYDEACVNNNGNVSFIECFSSFSSTGFPSANFRMVAGFWADVDTRGAGSGLAYYKQAVVNGSNVFVAHYDSVGYFNRQVDKRNSFQIVISDTATLPGGNNVCFAYGNMDWTTGGASGGSGGFGGTPATVGANKGDNTAFFQYGRFDKTGTDYDGPTGDNDGVDFLDGRQICFNTGDVDSANIPPIINSQPDAPLLVDNGAPFDFVVSFIPPESDQTIASVDIEGDGLSQPDDLTCTTTFGAAGGVTTVACSGSTTDAGTYEIEISATDDGSPARSTTATVTVTVAPVDAMACTSASPLFFSDWDVDTTDGSADPRGEYAEITNDAGDGTAVDLSGCDFVVFNPFTERVIYAADAMSVLADGDAYSFANVVVGNGQMVPPGTFPDDPSVFALLSGSASVGQSVGTVLSNTEVVAAVVLDRDGTLFGSVRGGADASAASNAQDLADAMARLFATAGEDGADEVALTVTATPNPISGSGKVSFGLDAPGQVTVELYDALGRQVALVAQGSYGPGRHDVGLSVSALPTGLYVVRVMAEGTVQTARLTVVR